ncbi:MAG: hypothetical protein ACKVU4_01730 [Phycisphaerales bacterium]
MPGRRIAAALILASTPALGGAGPPTTWKSVGIGGGGAFFAISFSPHNQLEIFVSSDMSDQFRTVDLCKTWRMTPFGILQSGRDAPKVQFTSNPDILYTINFDNEVRTPVKSTDRSLHWAPLPGDPTGAEAYSITADWGYPDRVWVSDYTALYHSANGGQTFAPRYVTGNANGLLVAGAYFSGAFVAIGTSDGLLISTNGGQTLAPAALTGIPAGERIVSFAGGKSGSTTRFFCVTLDTDVYPGIQGDSFDQYRGVYTLQWGQNQWQKVVSGILPGQYPFHVAMARNNPSVAYLAGGSDAGEPLILKTANAGVSWSRVFKTAGNQNIATGWSGSGGDRGWGYGEFAFGLAVHPTNALLAAFTDLGFVHLTTNGGAVWRQGYLNNSHQNPVGLPTPKGKSYAGNGLEDTSSTYAHWFDANTMWVGYGDIRGIRSTNAGFSWNFGYTGQDFNSSYQIARHPTTGVAYMAASSVHDLYQSTYLTDARIDGGTGQVLSSSDKGATWHPVGNLARPVIGVAIDKPNPATIFASVIHSTTGGIYRCSNPTAGAAATWTRLNPPPRTEGHPFNIIVLNDGSLVCTYSGRRAGSPLNFTPSSGVFLSTNKGQSWIDRSHPNMLYWTKDLCIDPHDPTQSTWYAAVFSGWGGAANDKGGLYRTFNRGQSWTRILNKSHVVSCTVDPAAPNNIYATTEQDGLWFTSTGAAFHPLGAFPFRQPERVFFNPFKAGEIWVTTFGGGTWKGQKS